MPYKNPEDLRAWKQANKEKCAAYIRKWADGDSGKKWFAKQQAAKELQKQLKAQAKESQAIINHQRKIDKHRAYRVRQRSKAIELLGHICVVCGMDDPDVLEFDHIEPVLRRSSGKKNRDVYKEVIKDDNRTENFQLLCANCHTKKTRINNEYGFCPDQKVLPDQSP